MPRETAIKHILKLELVCLMRWLPAGIPNMCTIWRGPQDYIRKNIHEDWRAFHHSPNFPSYPSGHSAIGGVSATILENLFGNVIDFTDKSHIGRIEFLGKPRHYNSFRQMAEECLFENTTGSSLSNGLSGRLTTWRRNWKKSIKSNSTQQTKQNLPKSLLLFRPFDLSQDTIFTPDEVPILSAPASMKAMAVSRSEIPPEALIFAWSPILAFMALTTSNSAPLGRKTS